MGQSSTERKKVAFYPFQPRQVTEAPESLSSSIPAFSRDSSKWLRDEQRGVMLRTSLSHTHRSIKARAINHHQVDPASTGSREQTHTGPCLPSITLGYIATRAETRELNHSSGKRKDSRRNCSGRTPNNFKKNTRCLRCRVRIRCPGTNK